MNERFLMIECRSLLRDFLRKWKEKLEEVVIEDENSTDSSANDASTSETLDDPLEPSSGDSSGDQMIAESMLTKTSRNKFVWTKRAVRIVVRRYERYGAYLIN